MSKRIFPELAGDKQAEEPVAECCICHNELYAGEVAYATPDSELVCCDCLEEWARRELELATVGEED